MCIKLLISTFSSDLRKPCLKTGEKLSRCLEFVLFLREPILHDVKQNEKYPYAYREVFLICLSQMYVSKVHLDALS